jgi:hypothetical protein
MAKIVVFDEETGKDITFNTLTDCAICGEKHNIENADEGEVCEKCFFDRRRMANPAW